MATSLAFSCSAGMVSGPGDLLDLILLTQACTSSRVTTQGHVQGHVQGHDSGTQHNSRDTIHAPEIVSLKFLARFCVAKGHDEGHDRGTIRDMIMSVNLSLNRVPEIPGTQIMSLSFNPGTK